MIIMYTAPGCASCRKAKNWLKEREIEYVEKNIFVSLLNDDEIKFILSRSENGTDDIISKRSKIILESKIDIDSMSTSQLIEFVRNNPSVLKRPIILDEKSLVVGYDQEEIEVFENNNLKDYLKTACMKDKCPNYQICSKMREE